MLPPNVLKNSMPLSNDAAISGVVTTAPERIAVADRLPEDDDVGNDALRLEGVEVRPHPAVRRLHFVRDADAAGGADDRVDVGEVAVRQDDLSADARGALGDERRRVPDLPRELGVFLAGARIVALVFPAIGIGQGQRRAPTAAPLLRRVR